MQLKKLFIFLFLIIANTTMYAQYTSTQYTSRNSFIRKALVLYQKNDQGFYQCKENVMADFVRDIVSVYAYDKKSQNLYARTSNGNYVITLNKDYAKLIKKNKQIPKLSEQEIDRLVNNVNNDLSVIFSAKNDSISLALKRKREKEIADSIELVRMKEREAERIKQAELAKEQAFEKYRKENIARRIPIDNTSLYCSVCNNSYSDDYVWAVSIQRDSICFLSKKTEALGDEYSEAHVAQIPSSLNADDNFLYHIEAFKDSLTNDHIDLYDIEDFNAEEKYHHIQRVKKKAPYGFIQDWDWGGEYFVTFSIRYLNLNPKTIKYIDVYWKITNDVNDLRGSGHFKGTGPLAQYESASWDWDSSTYFVAGDATNMSITKIILTYMNGSQKILNKSQIQYDDTDYYTDEIY